MLTEEDLALGHRIAGAWLEQRGEDDPLMLAEHFEKGSDRERAAHHWSRAAERASWGGDTPRAITYIERGLQCPCLRTCALVSSARCASSSARSVRSMFQACWPRSRRCAWRKAGSPRPSAAAEEGLAKYEVMGTCSQFFHGASLRLVHVECLVAAGQHDAACAAIAKAEQRILANAAKIQDPAYRQSFLENVPENRRTLALAKQRLGERV